MSDAKATVGFIGLGNMGAPMSRRLVEAGYDVRAFDVSPEARTHARESGATDVETAAGAADGADIVILMLPTSAIMASVAEEILAAGTAGPGAILIDMSSSDPFATRTLAERVDAAGLRLVDAPVSGGVKGAVGGTLTIMTGGDGETLAEVEPVLAVLGRTVHAGGVGAGHAVKAFNNLLSATHLWVTSEIMEAGKRFGLDPDVMLAIFNGSSGRSGSTENKWPNFIMPETFDSGFGLRLMLKDMQIATQLARQTGAPSLLGEDAVELWAEAADELPPAADHTEVALWIRSLAERAEGAG